MRLVARIEIINEDTGEIINKLQTRPVDIKHYHYGLSDEALPESVNFTEYWFQFALTIADNIKDA